MKKNKIILFGLGPHAKRIYIPLIEDSLKDLELRLVVDLNCKKEDISEFILKRKVKPELRFIDPFIEEDKIPPELERYLNKFVAENEINGVIVSTEPLCHFAYIKWALSKGLSVLTDKPLSTYRNISTNIDIPNKLIKDYMVIENLYKMAKKKNPLVTCSIMSQRRFHPMMNKVREIIRDCYKKTNCPITSIQVFHSDGQWRMPSEIVDQLYHPYMQGYGKCSHSGYHFFDIVPIILNEALGRDKYYDNVEVFSNFIRPLDFIEQITIEDYEHLFGKKKFLANNKYTKAKLKVLMKKYGEIDSFINICFKKGKRIISNASINLCHTGFGQRNWVTAKGRDLYKGNGRIRHESYIIEQGPFQAIHIHSFQSKEVNPHIKQDLYKIGGEHHFEVHVFRNTKMIGGKEVENLTIKDFDLNLMKGKSRGHQEDARAIGFLEFIESLSKVKTFEEMTSDLTKHKPGIILMSAIYQSAAASYNGKYPVIKKKFNLPLKIKN